MTSRIDEEAFSSSRHVSRVAFPGLLDCVFRSGAAHLKQPYNSWLLVGNQMMLLSSLLLGRLWNLYALACAWWPNVIEGLRYLQRASMPSHWYWNRGCREDAEGFDVIHRCIRRKGSCERSKSSGHLNGWRLLEQYLSFLITFCRLPWALNFSDCGFNEHLNNVRPQK